MTDQPPADMPFPTREEWNAKSPLSPRNRLRGQTVLYRRAGEADAVAIVTAVWDSDAELGTVSLCVMPCGGQPYPAGLVPYRDRTLPLVELTETELGELRASNVAAPRVHAWCYL